MVAAVVTISAPYGTGGIVIGPAVAKRLDVPFLDRAIPVSVAKALAVPVADVLARDERAETRVSRVVAALAAAGEQWAPDPDTTGGQLPEHAYRAETERVIRDAADTTGSVILGRAAAIILAGMPAALHVCLGGSFERRVGRAIALSLDDEASVRRLLEDTDRNRAAFFRHLYRAEPDDPRLYHLMIDSTVLDYDPCVELIVTAARARTRTVT